jgi:hypothetical protein
MRTAMKGTDSACDAMRYASADLDFRVTYIPVSHRIQM